MPTGNPTLTTLDDRRRRLARCVAAAVLALAAGAGCRKDMYDQPKYEPYEPSTNFPDGTSSRPQVEATVARDALNLDAHYYEGRVDGKEVDTLPFPVDEETLELGKNRYIIYCSPCHGRVGDGRGMVVRRGFSPPPSLHSEYLKKIPVGHFYTVITHGYGAMYSYAARIPVRQRWAIAAYIRTLQYSQDADDKDLTDDDRKKLAESAAPAKPTNEHATSSAEVPK